MSSHSVLSAKAHEADQVVIRMSTRTRRTMGIAFAVIVGIVWISAAGAIIHDRRAIGLRVAIAIGFAVTFGVRFALLGRRRVVLGRDRIDITGTMLPTRRIMIADVVARSTNGARTPHQPILILKDGRRVKLPGYLEQNDVLSAWLRTLPYRPPRRW